jgi:hypothetical protein
MWLYFSKKNRSSFYSRSLLLEYRQMDQYSNHSVVFDSTSRLLLLLLLLNYSCGTNYQVLVPSSTVGTTLGILTATGASHKSGNFYTCTTEPSTGLPFCSNACTMCNVQPLVSVTTKKAFYQFSVLVLFSST